jgi:hypothetical protein
LLLVPFRVPGAGPLLGTHRGDRRARSGGGGPSSAARRDQEWPADAARPGGGSGALSCRRRTAVRQGAASWRGRGHRARTTWRVRTGRGPSVTLRTARVAKEAWVCALSVPGLQTVPSGPSSSIGGGPPGTDVAWVDGSGANTQELATPQGDFSLLQRRVGNDLRVLALTAGPWSPHRGDGVDGPWGMDSRARGETIAERAIYRSALRAGPCARAAHRSRFGERTQADPGSSPQVGPPGPGRCSLRLRSHNKGLRPLRCAEFVLSTASSAFGSGRSHRPSAAVDAAARPPALSGWWRGRPVLGDIGRLRRPTSVIALR